MTRPDERGALATAWDPKRGRSAFEFLRSDCATGGKVEVEGPGQHAAGGDAARAFPTKTTESMTPRVLAIMAMLMVAKALLE